MRVVADSHVLIFYLFTPIRLSDPALEALGEAEDDAGIVVSAATLGDLWYASHKSGANSLAPGAFESLRRTVLDPATNFDVVPVTADTMTYFDRVPLIELADPFDRVLHCVNSGATTWWGLARAVFTAQRAALTAP